MWETVIESDTVKEILDRFGVDYECYFIKSDSLDIDQENITTTIDIEGYFTFTQPDRVCGEHWKYLRRFRVRDLMHKGLDPEWFKQVRPAFYELCKIIQKGADQ